MNGPVGASPAAPPLDHQILDLVRRRGIKEVLHFTTNHGLLGIAASSALVSRKKLDESPQLEHIRRPNCVDRFKDADWVDYVSMSIHAVNTHMFGYSKGWQLQREGGDAIGWVVLSFDAQILAHPGVQFVTTNNTYSQVLRRGTGAESLEELFGPRVAWGRYGSVKTRSSGMPDSAPTDSQAEVLYPTSVPLRYLTGVYVRDEEDLDHVTGLGGVFSDFAGIPVAHRPEVFQ